MKEQNDKINGLHHIGIINTELNLLAETYERLGFILTPVSLPKVAFNGNAAPAELGVGNRCAIFRNNYLELLGVVDQQQWASFTTAQRGPFDIDVPLSRYLGLHVMHFGTDHIEGVKQRLDELHISCSEIMSFQRKVQTSEGSKTMRARSIGFPVAANPEALLQIAQHDTPELIFQPRYMTHPNGACDIREIIICVSEPEKYARKYEAYTGHSPQAVGSEVMVLNLDNSRLIITSPDGFGDLVPDYLPPTLPFLAAFTVQTNSLVRTKQVLQTNDITFLEKDGFIAVDRHDAGGCTVIFTEQGIDQVGSSLR